MSTKINKDKAVCYSLLCFFALYLSQSVVGRTGVIGPPILTLIGVISVVYMIKYSFTLSKRDPNVFLWLLFFAYNFMHYVFSDQVFEYSEFRQIALNMLPLFAFYHFAEKGILTVKELKVFFVVMLVLFIASFFNQARMLMDQTGREEFTNNVSYFVMGLLPFVFVFRRTLVTAGLLVLLSWFAIISSKRAVLILCIIAIMLFLYSFIIKNKGSKKLKGIFLASFFGCTFIMAIVYYYNNFGFGERFEERLLLMVYEGHSAGRDTLFINLYRAWINSGDTLVYLFGLGYRGAIDATGAVTHNDLIKSLGEGGLLGLVLFVTLVGSLCLNWFKPFARDQDRLMYAMFICSMLIAIATSRWYGSAFFYMNCVLLPYLLVAHAKSRKRVHC